MTLYLKYCNYCGKKLHNQKSKYCGDICLNNYKEYHRNWYLANKINHNLTCIEWHFSNRTYHIDLMKKWRMSHGRIVWLSCQNRYNEKNPPKTLFYRGNKYVVRQNSEQYQHYLTNGIIKYIHNKRHYTRKERIKV